MRPHSRASPVGPWINISQSALEAVFAGRSLELPLERTAAGLLEPSCRERVARELAGFLGRRARPLSVACALPAQGASLRRFAIPPAPREAARALLALQMEKDLPLPPERFAWGFELDGERSEGTRRAGEALGEATVVLLRKELVEDHAALLRAARLAPRFTLGALAASAALERPAGRWLLLDLGRAHAELLALEGERPLWIRLLPWGGEAPAERREEARASIDELAAALHRAVAAESGGGRAEHSRAPLPLLLAGAALRTAGLESGLGAALGEGFACRAIEGRGDGASAVLRGLAASAAEGRLRFEIEAPPSAAIASAPRSRRSQRRWAAAALALGALCLALRYGPPYLEAARLEQRIESARQTLASLPPIDGELGFLKVLDASQLPYLDVLLALSQCAPGGTRFDTLTLNRQGELSLQGSVGGAGGPNELRRRLLESGGFQFVVIQEQKPVENDRTQFRLSARAAPGAAKAAGGAP